MRPTRPRPRVCHNSPILTRPSQDEALPLARALAVRKDIPSTPPLPPPLPSSAPPTQACIQFENLISTTIEETNDIPEIISETGKIDMNHKEIMKKIGELFLLRTNINSVGSVLDSPVRAIALGSTAPMDAPR